VSWSRDDADTGRTPGARRRRATTRRRRAVTRRRGDPDRPRRRLGPRPWLAARWGLDPSALPAAEGEERHASWLELFFDLVFVLALLAVQNRLHGSTPSYGEILQAAGLYAVVWGSWAGQAFYDTRFDPDDAAHRLAVLVGMLGAAGMAIGAEEAPDTLLLPLGYLVVRGTLLALYLRVRGISPNARRLTTVYLTGFGLGSLLWAVSLALPVPLRPVLWIVGLVIELLTPWVGQRWLVRHPVHPLHLPERIGQFTIILLGVSLTDVLDAVPARPSMADVGVAIAAFAIPASVWWVYTTLITVGLSVRRLHAGAGYSAVHGPFGAALLLLGWALGQIVREIEAHSPELPGVLRLLVAASLGIWMLCGLALQRISLGHLPPSRIAATAVGVALVVLVPAATPSPTLILPLLAVAVICHAVVVAQMIMRLGAERPSTVQAPPAGG